MSGESVLWANGSAGRSALIGALVRRAAVDMCRYRAGTGFHSETDIVGGAATLVLEDECDHVLGSPVDRLLLGGWVNC